MKQGRFSEEQIIAILMEVEAGAGAKVTELCRRHGISDATFYTWRSKYGGLEVSEMRRLRQLEEENRRLKAIVADHVNNHPKVTPNYQLKFPPPGWLCPFGGARGGVRAPSPLRVRIRRLRYLIDRRVWT